MRKRYLVAYDIRDPKRLRSVAKVLEAYGSRMQYSVFVCDLTIGELCDLRADVRDEFLPSVDSIVVIPLGKGYDVNLFEFLGVRPSLPIDGARIV